VQGAQVFFGNVSSSLAPSYAIGGCVLSTHCSWHALGLFVGGINRMTREELVIFASKLRADYRRTHSHKTVLIKRREAASENLRRGALLSRGNINVSSGHAVEIFSAIFILWRRTSL
jgi:hypothetical protein